MSLTREINLLKGAYSYLKSTYKGMPVMYGMPVAIGTELTNYCNLNCPECLSGSGLMERERGFMSIELYKKILKELHPYLYNINLYFQGESMLHPQFFSFIRNTPLIGTTVSTNGHFLSEINSERIVRSSLRKLIISLDGIDQETYSLYRYDGNINTVLNGIYSITKARKKFNSSLKVEIQFLVSLHNEHQIPDVRILAKKAGASLSLKSMQVIDRNNAGSWLPSNNRYGRYRMNKGEFVIKNSLPNRCARLWFNPVVTWDGNVLPCCFDKNGEHVMGNLNYDSFRDIWNGTKFRIFRKNILSGRYMVEICRNCTSGMRGVSY